MEQLDKEAWNRLAKDMHGPFFSWEWLNGLEQTGCVKPERGWQPVHLALHDEDENLLAVAPLYVKGHSRGEFVFDHGWADAAHRMGIEYYPKLLGMSPFTPARGYRFMIDESLDEKKITSMMLTVIERFCRENKISGTHFLHVDHQWCRIVEDLGWRPWLHHSLIWENQNFTEFEDYVQTFKSKRRNNIRRERKRVAEHLDIRVIPGEAAGPEQFDQMYDFYEETCRRFYGWSHYLNRDFFHYLGEHLSGSLNLIAAYERDNPNEPVAMSGQAKKGGRLYGRFWGARKAYDQLHFELCYYQAIEHAIQTGMTHFDAGSGSADQKQRRGFPAVPNYSLHRFYDETFQEVFWANIERVNLEESLRIKMINGDLRR